MGTAEDGQSETEEGEEAMMDNLNSGYHQESHDLEAILRRGFETKDLDYKGPCIWNEKEKKACCELVKDVLAIANAKGGFIVIGVSEIPTGFSWDGLTDEQCESFETSRLNRFIQNYTDPPINAHAVKYTSEDSRYVIIDIPRFSDTPHICQKDYPEVLEAGTIYVRTDNNESAPIKDSADMRAIVEHAVRNRSDQLLTSFRAILTGTSESLSGPSDIEQFTTQTGEAASHCNELVPSAATNLGFRETILHPARFDRLRFTMPDLEQMAETASVTYRGWPYIFYAEKRADCITHREDSLDMLLSHSEGFQFWRLHQSGCLYVNEMFQEDERTESRSKKVLGTVPFAYTCAEAVQCLVDLFTDRLADDESVRLHMRLHGVQGRTLAMVRGDSYASTPYQCEADQIVYDEQHPLADWRAGVIPHAIDILRHVHAKFNAPTPSDSEVAPLMQRLLNRQV